MKACASGRHATGESPCCSENSSRRGPTVPRQRDRRLFPSINRQREQSYCVAWLDIADEDRLDEAGAREEFLARHLAADELGPLFESPRVRAELERDWNYRFS